MASLGSAERHIGAQISVSRGIGSYKQYGTVEGKNSLKHPALWLKFLLCASIAGMSCKFQMLGMLWILERSPRYRDCRGLKAEFV